MESQMNRGPAKSLAERGARVALLDLHGYGRSDKPPQASAHRMDSYADEVVAFFDHLGVGRAVIGGVSLGAGASSAGLVLGLLARSARWSRGSRVPERDAGLG